MPTVPFIFEDFNERMQQRVVDAVREYLLAHGDIEREDGESDAAFEDRLAEAVDDYINTHNFSQAYEI